MKQVERKDIDDDHAKEKAPLNIIKVTLKTVDTQRKNTQKRGKG